MPRRRSLIFDGALNDLVCRRSLARWFPAISHSHAQSERERERGLSLRSCLIFSALLHSTLACAANVGVLGLCVYPRRLEAHRVWLARPRLEQ